MVLFFSLRIFQVPVLILGLSALWTGEFFSQKKFFLKILSHSQNHQNPGNKKLYPLLLIYATSAVTTVLPCLVYSLSLPSPSSSTPTPSDLTLTFEQRFILLSGYIPFFLVPLTMLLDMASRVYELVLKGLKTETEKWE